ncbi:MAG: hypothetical protein HN922_00125 [Anaerolineae bacterium]|jgi:hypothetical protein|nr:hypothetical protein [Anaerolineae bacterium]MBT7781435.1 hypothetical protein [Anaerolineae bacterium]
MSEEIKFREEDNIAEAEEGKNKNGGTSAATFISIITIQLFGLALVVVLGFAYLITMGVTHANETVAYLAVAAIAIGAFFLIIRAWVFYSRGDKATATGLSFGIFALLILYFLPPVVLILGVVLIVGWAIYKKDVRHRETLRNKQSGKHGELK